MSIQTRVQQRSFSGAADQAVVSLLVAADYVDQALTRVLLPYGITSDQHNLLRILRGVHPGGHPRNEISARLIRRSPDVTRMIDRLVARKLVVRARGREDRRESLATITSAGLALLKRTDPVIEEIQEQLTAVLSAADKRQLSRLCEALVR
jgi:DNA-binding MarR family transcriptional regulator